MTVIRGTGKILGSGKIDVAGQIVETKNIVIATGSDVAKLKGIEIDEKQIVSSTGALELAKVPAHLAIIGAGVIGLELGSVYARLGAKITGIEYLDRILPAGPEVATLSTLLQKRVYLQLSAGDQRPKANRRTLQIEPNTGGAAESLDADTVLVAIGRTPFTEGLGCEKAGIKRDDKGRIEVGSRFETSLKGVYAIGDVIRGPMLAHKAEDEGVALAELLAGQAGHVNYDVIPGVVYTSPEVAAVGKTEEELKAAGIEYKAGKFLFLANGRAKANQTTDGFVKILADARTDRVLGAHIIGPVAGELIHEIAVLMEFGGSAEDLARTCHAHPTMSEAVKEPPGRRRPLNPQLNLVGPALPFTNSQLIDLVNCKASPGYQVYANAWFGQGREE